MHYLENILFKFSGLDKKSKLGLLGLICIVLTGSLILSVQFISPTYGVLFSDLEPTDAKNIVSQLDKSHIPYQVQNHGQRILIEKNNIEKTRLQLMDNGMRFSGSIGFELFDKSDFGMTEFSQKINYQRALQGELERTIASLEEIHQARVHLVLPESRLFQNEKTRARAAVTLHLKSPLTGAQIKSIQALMKASVAGLENKHIIIVDNNGNSLTTLKEDAGHAHFTTKKSLESYLTHKVTHMLQKVFTKETVVVTIDVTLNYNQLSREKIKPQTQGIITFEKETQQVSTEKEGKTKAPQQLTREKTMQYGREKEHFTKAQGSLERLSISVAVPLHTEKSRIAQIERLVKSTVGFNQARGDTISVEPLLLKKEVKKTPMPTYLKPPEVPESKILHVIVAGIFLFLLLFGASIWQYKKRRQRQVLLTELTHWLNHHAQ
jgi:flagellar M-ring protein FliF